MTWIITSLQYFLEKTGHVGLNNIISAYPDKSAYAQCIFAYCRGRGQEVVVFVGRTEGLSTHYFFRLPSQKNRFFLLENVLEFYSIPISTSNFSLWIRRLALSSLNVSTTVFLLEYCITILIIWWWTVNFLLAFSGIVLSVCRHREYDCLLRYLLYRSIDSLFQLNFQALLFQPEDLLRHLDGIP